MMIYLITERANYKKEQQQKEQLQSQHHTKLPRPHFPLGILQFLVLHLLSPD